MHDTAAERLALQELWLPFAEAYLKRQSANYLPPTYETDAIEEVAKAATQFLECLSKIGPSVATHDWLVSVYFKPMT